MIDLITDSNSIFLISFLASLVFILSTATISELTKCHWNPMPLLQLQLPWLLDNQ